MTAVLLLSAASTARAQSAEKIVELHIKALGASKALKSVTSVRLSGTVNGSGEFLWQTKAPSSYYLEVRDGNTRAIEAFNGKSAWRDDSPAGLRTLTGNEQVRARATAALRNGHFISYKKDRTRLNLLGREAVEGRAAYALEVTTTAGIRRKVFFDAQTYLVIKEEQERDGGLEEILFGDYRGVDGVQEPHRIRIRRGSVTLDLAVQKAVHNGGVEAALFDFPRRDGKPLPDVATLLKELQDNQEAIEKALADYTFTKVETEIELDDRGRVEKSSERTFHVFYVEGMQVEHLVARDGQALKPEDARKEQERVDQAVREHKKKTAEKKAREARRAAKDSKEEGDELGVAAILRMCQFVNGRRDRFRGQDVVVYDFEPRPGEKPRRRLESMIQKFVGNVWIDEQARMIVRLEARVTDPIKMGGGLVFSVHRGSSFVFEQQLVNGEVWLPSYSEVNASARVLLVKGFKVNQTQRFSDYKKFEVDTSSAVKPPGE